MKFQHALKYTGVASLIVVGLAACGGGGSGSSNPPVDPPTNPPPAVTFVDFGNTVSNLVVPDGSATLPDGRTYDAESAPIEISDYTWDIDDSDVDESPLDDVFNG